MAVWLIVSLVNLLLIKLCQSETEFIDAAESEYKNQSIECIADANCVVYCNRHESCSHARIQCPIGHECTVFCGQQSNACNHLWINATHASSFNLNDCQTGDDSTCRSITIYFPSSSQQPSEPPRAHLNTGDKLSGDFIFYAQNGWSDIHVANANHPSSADSAVHGVLYCTDDYSESCNVSHTEWQCAMTDHVCNEPVSVGIDIIVLANVSESVSASPTSKTRAYIDNDSVTPSFIKESDLLWILVVVLVACICWFTLVLLCYMKQTQSVRRKANLGHNDDNGVQNSASPSAGSLALTSIASESHAPQAQAHRRKIFQQFEPQVSQSKRPFKHTRTRDRHYDYSAYSVNTTTRSSLTACPNSKMVVPLAEPPVPAVAYSQLQHHRLRTELMEMARKMSDTEQDAFESSIQTRTRTNTDHLNELKHLRMPMEYSRDVTIIESHNHNGKHVEESQLSQSDDTIDAIDVEYVEKAFFVEEEEEEDNSRLDIRLNMDSLDMAMDVARMSEMALTSMDDDDDDDEDVTHTQTNDFEYSASSPNHLPVACDHHQQCMDSIELTVNGALSNTEQHDHQMDHAMDQMDADHTLTASPHEQGHDVSHAICTGNDGDDDELDDEERLSKMKEIDNQARTSIIYLYNSACAIPEDNENEEHSKSAKSTSSQKSPSKQQEKGNKISVRVDVHAVVNVQSDAHAKQALNSPTLSYASQTHDDDVDLNELQIPSKMGNIGCSASSQSCSSTLYSEMTYMTASTMALSHLSISTNDANSTQAEPSVASSLSQHHADGSLHEQPQPPHITINDLMKQKSEHDTGDDENDGDDGDDDDDDADINFVDYVSNNHHRSRLRTERDAFDEHKNLSIPSSVITVSKSPSMSSNCSKQSEENDGFADAPKSFTFLQEMNKKMAHLYVRRVSASDSLAVSEDRDDTSSYMSGGFAIDAKDENVVDHNEHRHRLQNSLQILHAEINQGNSSEYDSSTSSMCDELQQQLNSSANENAKEENL